MNITWGSRWTCLNTIVSASPPPLRCSVFFVFFFLFLLWRIRLQCKTTRDVRPLLHLVWASFLICLIAACRRGSHLSSNGAAISSWPWKRRGWTVLLGDTGEFSIDPIPSMANPHNFLLEMSQSLNNFFPLSSLTAIMVKPQKHKEWGNWSYFFVLLSNCSTKNTVKHGIMEQFSSYYIQL